MKDLWETWTSVTVLWELKANEWEIYVKSKSSNRCLGRGLVRKVAFSRELGRFSMSFLVESLGSG